MDTQRTPAARGKILTGTVISTAMNNTVVIEVEHVRKHPLYQKQIRRHTHFKAHSEHIPVKKGDRVLIQETKPYSKTVHFRVTEIMTQKKKEGNI